MLSSHRLGWGRDRRRRVEGSGGIRFISRHDEAKMSEITFIHSISSNDSTFPVTRRSHERLNSQTSYLRPCRQLWSPVFISFLGDTKQSSLSSTFLGRRYWCRVSGQMPTGFNPTRFTNRIRHTTHATQEGASIDPIAIIPEKPNTFATENT